MSEHVGPDKALSLYVMMSEQGSKPLPAEAQRLFTSLQQQVGNLRRGQPGSLPPPVESIAGRWSVMEQASGKQPWPADLRTHVHNVRRTIERALRVFVPSFTSSSWGHAA